MPNKRDVIESLPTRLLKPLLETFELTPAERNKAGIVNVLTKSKRVALPEILKELPKDGLQFLCDQQGLKRSGKKAELIERIISNDERVLGEVSLDDAGVPAVKEVKPTKPEGKGKRKGRRRSRHSTQDFGFEATLFEASEKLRNNMDAGEFKHVVLGLIFLKYVSDAFEGMHEPVSYTHLTLPTILLV